VTRLGSFDHRITAVRENRIVETKLGNLHTQPAALKRPKVRFHPRRDSQIKLGERAGADD